MTEVYAFLGAFTLQILTTSVLYPAWFTRYVQARATRLSVERLAQLYPGVDFGHAQEHFLTQYRALNTSIAMLGSLLMVCLFGYMRRPSWGNGPVEALVALYFLAAQMLPLGLLVWLGVRFNEAHKRSLPQRKRKAILQRRGLFDFVPKFVVSLAVSSYFLFAAFVIYNQQHPFPGFAGLINIGTVTLVYAVSAFVVYTMLYGSRGSPFETHAGRLHTISVGVKSSIYSCIAVVAFLSLNITLGLLDLQRWEPFVLSVFFVICALLTSLGVIAPLRQPEVHERGPNSVR